MSFLSVLVVLGALGIGSEVAGAGPCGERVVEDWSDGRIDRVYRLRCYHDAVDGLPEDVRVYSSAVDDISRALQARVHAVTGRGQAGEVGGRAVPAPEGARAAEPPLVLLILVASTLLVAVAGAGSWIAQTRRRRA